MTVLKNGFTLIEQLDKGNGEAVVLGESKNRQEFATWWMNPQGDTFWGNYFSYYNENEAREEALVQARLDLRRR